MKLNTYIVIVVIIFCVWNATEILKYMTMGCVEKRMAHIFKVGKGAFSWAAFPGEQFRFRSKRVTDMREEGKEGKIWQKDWQMCAEENLASTKITPETIHEATSTTIAAE
jgi:hypothetical protein